jgi:hypothetical protein
VNPPKPAKAPHPATSPGAASVKPTPPGRARQPADALGPR